MADDDIELTDEAPKKSKLKLIILGMAGMFVIVGITVGGLFAGGLLKMPESSSASSEASAEEAEAKSPTRSISPWSPPSRSRLPTLETASFCS